MGLRNPPHLVTPTPLGHGGSGGMRGWLAPATSGKLASDFLVLYTVGHTEGKRRRVVNDL